MENTIRVHGIILRLVGHGFSPNEDDFNKVCDIIELVAIQLDKAAIEAVIWDCEADDYRNRDDLRLYAAIDSICVKTLRDLGWDKPHVPSISVFGQP